MHKIILHTLCASLPANTRCSQQSKAPPAPFMHTAHCSCPMVGDYPTKTKRQHLALSMYYVDVTIMERILQHDWMRYNEPSTRQHVSVYITFITMTTYMY